MHYLSQLLISFKSCLLNQSNLFTYLENNK
nr:MAG TPA: hypothetical protein [Caudoviricetes sp.]